MSSLQRHSKHARNLLLDFDHAQVTFGLVVGSSRQLHRLPLWRKEALRSPIPFVPYLTGSHAGEIYWTPCKGC